MNNLVYSDGKAESEKPSSNHYHVRLRACQIDKDLKLDKKNPCGEECVFSNLVFKLDLLTTLLTYFQKSIFQMIHCQEIVAKFEFIKLYVECIAEANLQALNLRKLHGLDSVYL